MMKILKDDSRAFEEKQQQWQTLYVNMAQEITTL